MVLVVIGLCVLALSAVNGAKRLADLSRYSATTAPASDTVFAPPPNLTRFDSPDSKADLPSYETAVKHRKMGQKATNIKLQHLFAE